MSSPDLERTFPNNPNPPPTLTVEAPPVSAGSAPPAPAETGGAPTAAEAKAAVSPTPSITATFKVVGRADGSGRDVFMRTSDLRSTKLGPVSIPDADKVLDAVGLFNEKTKSWTVPESVAKSLLSGRLGYPDFLAAKFRAGEATVVRGLLGSKYMRRQMSREDARAHGNIELIKTQVGEQPQMAWRNGFAPMVAQVLEDPIISAGETARFATGETAQLLPFVLRGAREAGKDALILGVGAAVITAGTIGTKGLGAPVAVTAIAAMMNTGAAYGVFRYTMDVEGGNTALDMIEAGFDDETIRRIAPIAGAAKGLLEMVGFKYLAAPFKRVAISNLFKSPAVRKALAAWYVTYAKELGAEVTVEAAQEAIDVFANNIAAIAEEKPELLVSAEDAGDRIVDTVIRSMAGIAILKIPGAAVDIAAQRRQTTEEKAAEAEISKQVKEFEKEEAAPVEGPAAPEEAVVSPEAPAEPLGEEAGAAVVEQAISAKTEEILEQKPIPERAAQEDIDIHVREVAEQAEQEVQQLLDTDKVGDVQELARKAKPEVTERLTALQRGEARVERRTQAVEQRARVTALQSDLVDVNRTIRALTTARKPLIEKGIPTRRIDQQLKGLFAERTEVLDDLAVRQVAEKARPEVGPAEVLELKPVTLESVTALAFKEGEKAGAAEVQAQVRGRAKEVLGIAKLAKLTQADIQPLLANKNFGTMGEAQFRNFIDDFRGDVAAVAERKAAMKELNALRKEKRLKSEKNVRFLLKLPPTKKMTLEQIDKYIEALKGYGEGETVLTPKRVRVLGLSEWAGAKTYEDVLRKAGARMDFKSLKNFRTFDINKADFFPVSAVPLMDPPELFSYDTLLAQGHPILDLFVMRMKVAQIKAATLKFEFQEVTDPLAKKALASRAKLLSVAQRKSRALVPRQPEIRAYIEEQDPNKKAGFGAALTEDEFKLAEHYLSFGAAEYKYFVDNENLASSRFIGSYAPHIRRRFSEMGATLSDVGLKRTTREFVARFKDKNVKTTVRDKSGKILSMSVFMKNTVFRTGELIPSDNMVDVFDTLADQFYDKVAFDEAIPAMETLVTAFRVVEPHNALATQEDSVKFLLEFLRSYLNAKKGNAEWAIPQGGKAETMVRFFRDLSGLAWIALNSTLQLISPIGATIVEVPVLGRRELTGRKPTVSGLAELVRIKGLKFTKKGKAIRKKYKGLIGRGLFEEISRPGKTFEEKVALVNYGIFKSIHVEVMEDLILGAMSPEEFEAETLTPERLARIQIFAGRWIDMHGSKSVRGSSVLGAGYTQFKGWAIPPLTSIAQDMRSVAASLRVPGTDPKQRLTESQIVELFRIAETGIVALMVLSLTVDGEDDDYSYSGRLRHYLRNEIASPFTALNLFSFLGVGAWATYMVNFANNLFLLAKLEEYKTKEGLKGWEGLKKQMPFASAIRPFVEKPKD